MSESGKVSLLSMTPERKEEIGRIRRFWGNSRHNIRTFEAKAKYDIVEEAQRGVNLLLSALEEAEQQQEKMKLTLEAEKARGDKWEKAFDNADRQYLKQEKAAADLRRELAEAQQTIARAITIYETADMETDFDDVLTGMYEALKGSGEGAKGVMTQLQTMSDQELNRKLAELMGYTVDKHRPGRVLKGNISSMPTDYCTDPAASLEVQTKAIEVNADLYVKNLEVTVTGGPVYSVLRLKYMAQLLNASPRQRAEAAYMTLSQGRDNI